MKKFMFIMITAIAVACVSCHTNGSSGSKSDVDSISNDTTMVVDSVSTDSVAIVK